MSAQKTAELNVKRMKTHCVCVQLSDMPLLFVPAAALSAEESLLGIHRKPLTPMRCQHKTA